jgi:hypothetical protein
MDQALPIAAEAALSEGRLITAIRIVRQTEKLDLTQAKSRVDGFLAQNPELRTRIEQQTRAMRRKLILWVFVIDTVVLVALLYWFLHKQ